MARNLVGISVAMPHLCAFPDELFDARYGGPTKVIRGRRSGYVVEHDGAAFRPMFSDLEVEVVDAAGHWVHADQPAVLSDIVRRALGERDVARSPTQDPEETTP